MSCSLYFYYLEIITNKKYSIKTSTLLLLIPWLVCAEIISIIISSEITVKFSLKYPSREIESIQELYDSQINLVFSPSFIGLNKINDRNLFQNIKRKAELYKSIVPISHMLSKKRWIVDTSYGKSALFLYEVPLKQMAINFQQFLKPNVKFSFLRERYGNPFVLTIASSIRLNVNFRRMLNFRSFVLGNWKM